MLSKFHQNGVMHGCIDFFCLVCEVRLRTEEEVISHIDKPTHAENLNKNKCTYVESCPEDRIRKVNKGYYCEYCNILLVNMMRTKLHIQEDKHVFNRTDESEIKNSVFFKWANTAVIAFDDLLIEDNAWNGFIDNTCIICNDDFEDADIHKSETWHQLKLVQAKVQVGTDCFITRKIDSLYYQCLTCNVLVKHSEVMRHFDKSEHTKMYLDSRKAKRTLIDNIKNIKTEKTVNEKELKDAEKNIIVTKKESKTEITIKEQERTEIIQTYKLSKEFTTDPNAVLGLKDYIEMFANDGEAMCFLCEWNIPRNQVQQHVNGEHHQTMLQMQNDRTEKMKNKYGDPNDIAELNESETVSENVLAEEIAQPSGEKGTNRGQIIDSINVFQKNCVRIDLIGDKAFCMKCFNDIDFTFDTIKKHIEDHKNLTAETSGEGYPGVDLNHNKTDFKRPVEADGLGKANSPGTSKKADPETFAKENQLTYNIDHNLAFCRICERRVPSSMKSMREHVNGNFHQLKNKRGNDKPKDASEPKKAGSPLYKTKPMEDFIDTLTRVENAFRHDAIINDVICINILSFMMMTRNDDVVHCQVCEQNFYNQNEIKEHNKTRRHERAMRITPVLYNLKSEFVREVRADVFHCGYCNLVSAGYQSLQKHLQSDAHERRKSICDWCLERYLPQVLAQRAEEEEDTQLATVMRWLVQGRPNFMR